MSEPVSDHELRTRDAQLALRGEAAPPVVLDKRLGASLDLTTGRMVCPVCAMDGISLVQITGYPSPIWPQAVAVLLACRSCGREHAVELQADDGAVVLSLVTQRS